VTRTATDLIAGRRMAAHYRSLADSLTRQEAEPVYAAMPIARGWLRNAAAFCRRAARAEEQDPEVPHG